MLNKAVLTSRNALWLTYLALLGVLLPHTAWAFSQFEPDGWQWLGWIGAFAFESAIAGLTLRLKERIEETPNYRSGHVALRRLHFRYVNVFGIGLLTSLGVSALANWAHAVEFGRPFSVFGSYSVSPLLYSVAFGAVLPATSLIFARVLSEVNESEDVENPELVKIRSELRTVRSELKATESDRKAAEQRANDLILRLEQTEHLARVMFGHGLDKRTRILEVRKMWPELPNSSIALLTDSSPSYVSEVVNARN